MTRRLDSLTGLRFIAASFIVAVHSGFITSYTGLGRLAVGVSFFFVLSGFVLTWSWHGGRRRDFYQNRSARIVPAYLCAWVFGLVVSLAQHTPTSPGTIAATLTLTQAWVPNNLTYFGVNGVAWSLSCEVFFYALFPLLVVWILDTSVRQRRGVLLLAVISTILIQGVLAPQSSSATWSWATSVLPLARLPEFLAGIALACEMRAGWRCPRWLGVMSAVFLGVALTLTPVGSSNVALSIVPFVLVIAAAASADLAGARSLLRSRTMIALGSASYCLYLVHLPLYSIARLISHDMWTDTGKVLGIISVVAAALVLAALLHQFVERPAESALRSSTRPVDPGVKLAAPSI